MPFLVSSQNLKIALQPKHILRASVLILMLAAGWFACSTIHWPLVGDASLMHYVAFLIDHHQVPYRDVAEINLPGAFLPDWLVIHTLGGSALAWRTYDLVLLALAAAASMAVMPSRSGAAGAWAGLLFALLHGRDGLAQVGQRDLTVAVFLLFATVILLRAYRHWPLAAVCLFGLGVGTAATIKPTAMLFVLLAVPTLWRPARLARRVAPEVIALLAGLFAPAALAAAWLLRHGALQAFLHAEAVPALFHASLGRRPLGYLLQHSLSPVMPLVAIWLVSLFLAFWTKREASPRRAASQKAEASSGEAESGVDRNIVRTTLLLATSLGLVGYVVQGKGYPYHRYPFLLFLLATIAIDFDLLLRRRDRLRWLAAAVFLAAALFLGVPSAHMAGNYDWQSQEFQSSLKADLTAVAGRLGVQELSGRIQCLDTVSGCINTLYDMRLLQSSGLLYDEFPFHDGRQQAVRETRLWFLPKMVSAPPAVIVIAAPLFPSGPSDYGKLRQWPEFEQWLDENYAVAVDRRPTRAVRQGGPASVPAGYRIYLRRSVIPAG